MAPARRALRLLGLAAVGGLALLVAAPAVGAETAPTPVRAQLKWYDQAQFAGWYAAEDLGYFGDRGVDVTTRTTGPRENPVSALVDGTADVAVASLAQASALSSPERRFVNIAQVFQRGDTELICVARAGLVSASDLGSARIAASDDRQDLVRAMYAALFPGGAEPTFVDLGTDIESLTSRRADCIAGSSFNEYWLAQDAGLRTFVVTPAELGVVDVEDGLYVEESRLSDPAFRRSMGALFLGLQDGWEFARSHPSSAVELVLQRNRTLSASVQQRQLETVLELVGDDFGYFDVGAFETVDAVGLPHLPAELDDQLWTHEIYNDARVASGTQTFPSQGTTHYLTALRGSIAYRILLGFGVFAAGLAGALLGLRMGYRAWGITVLATLTALGGGVIRDVLIGAWRYPSYLTQDPTDIVIVLVAAGLVTLLPYVARSTTTYERVIRFAVVVDVFGFSVIALNGALIGAISDISVIWVPICAAITVAGGGILSDILVRREHQPFRGDIYEEVAVAASGILLLGLWLSESHEHLPVLVFATVLVTLAAMLVGRFLVLTRGLRYPSRPARAELLLQTLERPDPEAAEPAPQAYGAVDR